MNIAIIQPTSNTNLFIQSVLSICGNTFLKHKETRKSASLLDFRDLLEMETVGVERAGKPSIPLTTRFPAMWEHMWEHFFRKGGGFCTSS